ncbi:MAG: DNA polymerase III subunit epsilon [Alteromonadaceae bacterium]|nr:DNA polymerase III subunit epsilon [Alteromonadaceae bacterium]MBL6703951.1 DNA polymerase III subunit epsilon [Pseudomonadales bacterium]MBL6824009.1 DNA polymerase III subunit epsilon [Luminiphilus sp.]MDA0892665.1 DNA polymerase III subunit epsilon [Pseudomonadota bacterium]RPH12603.1 MAG: DNA polymerase III subunit epsilon [Alteromonadaceae bacterium TMED101]HCJ39642.1 DNA polymerase III subunit epsilon [Halieaceae bacterium]
MRQVVLDTETTGLEVSQGHRIIEIGCVEIIDRKLTGRHYHQYINPQRGIDQGALEVHGITEDFLADKPLFTKVVDEFMAFIRGADLVIHNAPFDVGFINSELKLADAAAQPLSHHCSVTDSLQLARTKHPGQRNSLDALCQRYAVDNSNRTLHGALLDAEILADVYLLMTGGQTHLGLSAEDQAGSGSEKRSTIRRLPASRPALKVIPASTDEMSKHEARLDVLANTSESGVVWRR